MKSNQCKQKEKKIVNKTFLFQAVNKACMLIYTSGTTGPPKGQFTKMKKVLILLIHCFAVLG
jgi:long-subunit acyl-CoA synthetase (AMP-forming)